ncbi:MAG: MobF family relaxase [Pseudomonadota bacterium]
MVASIGSVSSAGAAKSYYGKDNYYARESGDPAQTGWAGKGSDRLGLKGDVDLNTFETILNGVLPTGERIGQRAGETLEKAMERPHRPGVDLTFSPPKDVSLLLYLGGDKRILRAHRAAVTETLKWVERNLAATRVRNGQNVDAVKTGNLVMAKFEHDISRDRDPQLHTHTVIANMTEHDGKWRALHNDPLFRHRKTISLAYDAAMRENMRGLGYGVRMIDGKSGAYGIDGVPEAAKEEFSKGKHRIDEAASHLDNPTPSARGILAVKTRPSKTEMTATEKTAHWEHQGAAWKSDLVATATQAQEKANSGRLQTMLDPSAPEVGTFAGLKAKLVQRYFRPTYNLKIEKDDPYKPNDVKSERAYAARAAVSFAIRHLEEREAAFSLHHVRRAALEHGADGIKMVDIDREIRELRSSRKLVVDPKGPDATATTTRSVDHERQTEQLVRTNAKSEPLVDRLALQERLAKTTLTEGQQSSITTILAGDDRLVGVQGYAGTGKTTMMREAQAMGRDLSPDTAPLGRDLKSETERAGLSILALAPTHSAVRTLKESAGFEAQTVSSFMIEQRKGTGPDDLSDRLVVIDESSFLSTKNMNQVLSRLITLNPARIVLSGDKRQHGAVEAGRPFDIAQRAGMTTAIMKDIVRLPKDAEHADQRLGVELAAQGKVKPALYRLRENLVEGGDNPTATAVAAWKELPADRRNAAMIVAPGHRLRQEINAGIRAEMIEFGGLGKQATLIDVLPGKDLTRAEAMSPRAYEAGDVLKFQTRLQAVGANKGDIRTIVSVDEKRGRVVIENTKGRQRTVALSSMVGRHDMAPFSLHRRDNLELRENDKVLFTRTDREKDIAALDQARVARFDKDTVTLNMDGAERVFQRDDPALQGLSHAYAITSHASQGKTAADVIAVVDSSDRMLTSQVGFYVSVSRSADTLALIVDDKDRVAEALYRNSGIKSSALEAIERIETMTGLDQDPTEKSSDLNSSVERETDSAASVDRIDNTDSATIADMPEAEPDQDQEISL